MTRLVKVVICLVVMSGVLVLYMLSGYKGHVAYHLRPPPPPAVAYVEVKSPHRKTDTFKSPHRETDTFKSPHRETDTFKSPHRETDTFKSPHRETDTFKSQHRETDTFKSQHRETDTFKSPLRETDTFNTTPVPHRETDTVNTTPVPLDDVTSDELDEDKTNTERTTESISTPSNTRPVRVDTFESTASLTSLVGELKDHVIEDHVTAYTQGRLDYIPEEIALKESPCYDVKLASDPRLSHLKIKDKQEHYSLGDTVRVLIQLCNGYGENKTIGGDKLRARMYCSKNKAAVAGHVADHNNGTYTAVFEVFWSGQSVISVDITDTRETIAAHYRVRTQVLSLRVTSATFVSRNYKDTTQCHPFYERISAIYEDVCNLTDVNSGMWWYCGRPRSTYLTCSDWTRVSNDHPKTSFTGAELVLIKRKVGQMILSKDIKVNLDDQDPHTTIIKPGVRPSCSKYNTSLLWTNRPTNTGFQYQKKWYLKECEGIPSYDKCLTNTTLLLFGDSTIRQWYLDVKRRFTCHQITDRWTDTHWWKWSKCVNERINLKTEFLPNSQPSFTGNLLKTTSVIARLKEVKDDERVIVVVHEYLHLIPYHHDVLRSRMTQIKASVERLLRRNKLAKVLIKGPHIHNENPIELGGYYAYIYRAIILEVFKPLRDSVIYLDYIDISTALHVLYRHPSEGKVTKMVNMGLDYVCQ